MSRHGRYLRLTGLTFAVTLGLAAAVNVAVDPYGLFGSPRVAGVSAVKPEASSHSRIAKVYQVEAMRPATLIIGNSRPEMGLDPASTCWAEAERPVYNLGLPGASFRMQMAYLRHGVASGAVRTVVIGLDFLDFLRLGGQATSGEGGRGGESLKTYERRLAVLEDGRPTPHRWRQRLVDWWQASVSLDALKDSAATLAAQTDAHAADLRRDGFNPARQYLDIIAAEGQRVLFAQKEDELLGLFSRPGLHMPASPAESPELRALAEALAELQGQGIRPVLFLNPYHAEYLAAVAQAGLWPDFLRWKAALLALTEQAGVPLHDFNTLSPFAREAIPARGDKQTRLHWFWEPAHYTADLGEKMLGTMLGRPCGGAGESFGERLTEPVLSAQSRRLLGDLEAWKAAQEPRRVAGEGVVPVSSR